MADFPHDTSEGILIEFAKLFIGNRRGSGMSRTVFDHPFDPTLVIKVEDHIRFFQNVIEWDIWQHYKDDKRVYPWLAPCVAISQSGTFLIQKKARDLLVEETPKLLPSFCSDHKLDNYGMLDNHIVCRDYGTINILLHTTMQKWRGEDKKPIKAK